MNRTLNRLGSLLGVVFLLSVADAAVSGYLEPKGTVRIVAGAERIASGNLPAKIPSMERLRFEADAPGIRMEFLEAEGTLWRGHVSVDQSVAGSDSGAPHRFRVFMDLEVPHQRKPPEYTLLVFNSETAYRTSLSSVFEKHLGIVPWWITLGSLPLLLLCFGLSYRSSLAREQRLNQEGMASVFKITRCKEANEVSFGLGLHNGIAEGDSVRILDGNLNLIGMGEVKKTSLDYATAEVSSNLRVKPNFLVAKCS